MLGEEGGRNWVRVRRGRRRRSRPVCFRNVLVGVKVRTGGKEGTRLAQ